MQLVRAQSHKDTGPVGRQGVWAIPVLFGETRLDVVTRDPNSKDFSAAFHPQRMAALTRMATSAKKFDLASVKPGEVALVAAASSSGD